MNGVIVAHRDPPRVFPGPSSGGYISAYFGVRIDAAVNLREDRVTAGLDRSARLRDALSQQHQFLNTLLGYQDRAAFDLRLIADPEQRIIQVAVLGRTWGATESVTVAEAIAIRGSLTAALPHYVISSEIRSAEELTDLLNPVRGAQWDCAVITKRIISAVPQRPDAGAPHLFSVAPFSSVPADGNSLFAALSTCTARTVVSVGLFPVALSAGFRQQLSSSAGYYGRLAQVTESPGGLYYGRRKLWPDPFAVGAEAVFLDYLHRYNHRIFGIRTQVMSADPHSGIVEAFGAALAQPVPGAGQNADRRSFAANYETRRFAGPHAVSAAEWNLSAIDHRYPRVTSEVTDGSVDLADFLSRLTVLGDATEAACVFRLPLAVDGVVPGFAVRHGHFGHSEQYAPMTAAVCVGRLAEGGRPLQLPVASLTKHALIAGSPGSGKTTTAIALLRQLWVEHRIPFLVIEPVNAKTDDYRRLMSIPGCGDVAVFTAGNETLAPLRFNPFDVPYGTIVGDHIGNLLSCFEGAFALVEPLPDIYRRALETTYRNAGILSSEVSSGAMSGRWPNVADFIRGMYEQTRHLGFPGDVNARIEAESFGRARTLASGPMASVLLTDQSVDLGELLGRPSVIELKSLGNGKEQSLIMALLLNSIAEHYQVNRRTSSGSLAHVTVIEDAHRLLARPDQRNTAEGRAAERSAQAFANALAEMRRFGEGIVIVEQVPRKLVDDAVKNTNLKIMHRLTSVDDREFLGESMGFDSEQKRFSVRLGTGEGLVYSDEYAEATHVTVDRAPMVEPIPDVERLAVPPFAACSPCRAKCRYRGDSLAMMRDTDLLQELRRARQGLLDHDLGEEVTADRWNTLKGLLRRKLEVFTSPSDVGHDHSDAAYCLFLHTLAGDTGTPGAQWPAALARELRIVRA